MQGETKAWFDLAYELKKTVQYVKRTTTSSEFVKWKMYLRGKPNEFNPYFYYLANIVATLERVNSSKKRKIKLEDKLLEFTVKKEGKQPDSSQNKDLRLQQQKAAWFAAVGLPPQKV